MHIHELAKVYQAKTDEELLPLAMSPEQLTTEAHAALTGELARRRIDGQAMFRSDELTEGKWLTFAALLAKSVIGAAL